MTTFTTRVARALCHQEQIQTRILARLINGDKILSNTKSERVKKKHLRYAKAMVTINDYSNSSLLGLSPGMTDTEMRDALWKIQQGCLYAARKLKVSIPDCTGVMGRYRYSVIEDQSVSAVRGVIGTV